MVTASLLINILILVPICIGLYCDRPDFVRVFGVDTTARQIVMCIYLAILLVSTTILVSPQKFSTFLLPLLCMQIIYKLASVVFIKDKTTPVLWFNLAVAIFHSATVYLSLGFASL